MKLFSSIACLVLLLAMPAFGQDGYDLTWNTIDGGGGISDNVVDGYKLRGTIGQPDAGEMTSDDDCYMLRGGLWVPVPSCTSFEDCYNCELCRCGTCDVGTDRCTCRDLPNRPYADVSPVPCGDGAVEIMDTLCILDAARGTGDCLTTIGCCPETPFMIGDIYPCWPPEGTGPDGAVEIMDTLAVLDAAAGNPGCLPWCP